MSDFIEIEGEGLVYWPMCKTPGCGYRMNRVANNGYCWPCQPSGKSLSELLEDVRNDAGLPVRTGG